MKTIKIIIKKDGVQIVLDRDEFDNMVLDVQEGGYQIREFTFMPRQTVKATLDSLCKIGHQRPEGTDPALHKSYTCLRCGSMIII